VVHSFSGEGDVSATFQPDFEMNEENQHEFSAEGVACTYCGSSMSLNSHLCLTCGMPRPSADDKAGLRVATPSPKLMSVQKPYDPYAQFYSATPDMPKVIPPEPKFGASSFSGPSVISNPVPAEKIAEPTLPSNLRASAVVVAIVVFAFAVIFCLAMAWNSRGMIAANLDEVRSKLHDMGGSKPTPLPQYTATPISKADLAKRAVTAAPPAPKAPMEIKTLQSTPAPRPSGPGTITGVRIAPAPPTSNVIPVTIQNADNSVAPAEPAH